MTTKISIRERLQATAIGARQVWGLTGKNQLPVIIESSVLKELSEEMRGFRVSGGSDMDLQPWDQKKMQETVLQMYRKNHMAGRLLNIIVDFVVGDGISVQAVHEKDSVKDVIQDVIDVYWSDPINAMDRLNEQRCTEMNLWGEICMTVQRNEQSGRTRLGWVTPSAISKILPDPLSGHSGTVVLEDSAGGEVGKETLDVVRYRPSSDTWEGNAFFVPINTVFGSRRGISELYSSADWFGILDNTMKAQADRVRLLNNFLWSVELTGMDDDGIKDWLKKNGQPPKPNTIRAHNEKVKWDAKAPNLGAADFSTHVQNLKTHLMGGFGYPNHWFGSGDDANLATAAVMAEPTRKALRRKQRQFKWLLADMVRFELQSVQKAGGLAGVDLSVDPFNIQIPDLSGPDMSKISTAVATMVSAIAMAEEKGYLTHDTAAEMFASIGSETGFEITASVELEKLKGEVEEQLKKEKQEEENQEEEIQSKLKLVGKQPVEA